MNESGAQAVRQVKELTNLELDEMFTRYFEQT
jgi:hypothetical protein